MMRKDEIEKREIVFPSMTTDTWLSGAPVRLLVRGEPRVLKPDRSIREALFQFGSGRETAFVVAEQKDRPLGIVVLSDLLRAVTMHRVDLEEPIYAHMIAAPVTLPADASVHRARVTFTRGHLDHLLLVEADGRMQGLLSPYDLPGYREGGAENLVDRIMYANDVESMAAAAYAVRERASELFNNGMGVETLFGWMSGLNDLINIRVIELVANEFDLPPVSWCWMVFGSEGRVEQGFATDQDNGLIFQPDREEDTDEIRRAFLPFTRAVNLGLSRCGFTLCPGNIMAGNPEWCLSSREWHERFSNWMAIPEPEAILKATIFFDFRPLYGQDELADDLRQWLMPQPAQHPRFLHLLAEQSRTASPALNWLGRIVCDNDGSPHGVDLKKRGTRIFVDAARIWALQLGLFTTSTVERLRLSGPAVHRSTGDTNASIEALDILHRLRLQRQLAGGDAANINRVDPRDLTRPQRMLLKEAFKQARQLQWTLQRTFP